MAYLLLFVALVLLMIDGVIEVGFVGSMVGYLHHCHGDVPYAINGPVAGQTFQLFPKPKGLVVNQGHTSNGAAGTAVVLIGIGGCIVLWRQRRLERSNASHSPSRLYLTWTIFTLLSALLTLAAIIYTFVVTHQTDNQSINLATAAANNDSPYPSNSWTPENWYKAVLSLSFVDPSEMSSIRMNVHLMEGWRWNLIPLFLLGVAVCALALMNLVKDRSGPKRQNRESKAWLRGKGQA